MRGGPTLVAHWGQLASVIELVSGVALAGIGTGLSVLVAQAAGEPQRQRLLRQALRAGLGVSIPVALALAALGALEPRALALTGLSAGVLALGAAAGCTAVAPGMLNSCWLGQQRRGAMLALALGAAMLSLAVAATAPRRWLLEALACSQAVPVLLLAFALRGRSGGTSAAQSGPAAGQLLRYVPPSLAIGVLSPGAMIGARSIVSDALSWHMAGELQALWRVSDWVAAVAGGVLSVHFLPRLSASAGTPRFGADLARVARTLLLPCAVAFAVLLAAQRPVFALLYDPSVRIAYGTVALFFAGSFVRIAAWVPLIALYATRRTLAITLGEFLSLPLFTALLAAFSGGLTLERVGALWLAAYVVYAAFNLRVLAARREITGA